MPSTAEYIGAIDQGTTSTRFLIFDKAGVPVASHQMEFTQIYPKPGWMEHDPIEIFDTVKTCISKACEQFQKSGREISLIKAVGITNQRETTVVWNTKTGKPLHNAIVWSDARTTHTVATLKVKPGADQIQEKCGLPISTYFAAVKLRWLLDNVKEVQAAADEGILAFGTIDSWLLYNLTGGPNGGLHITDSTNGSRTMLLNIKTLEYDQSLIKFFGVEKVKLPTVVSSSEIYGRLPDGVLKGVPIAGCLGDQSAALVGHCAFKPGVAKNTYGTGCFLLYNTGEHPVISKNGLLTTVAYRFKGQKPVYALEGSIAVAGSAVKWLRDGLGLIKEAEETCELAAKVEDSAGVVFVTAFSGLFAPYWKDDARGTIVGITQYTKKEHIVRATLEATCFQTKAILDAMNKDSGKPLAELKVDGGMTNNDVCMQLQSDILGIEVDRPQMREVTALGSAIAAGFAVGVWKSFDELKEINTEGRTRFKPSITEEARTSRFKLWERAVERAVGWEVDQK